MHLCIHVSLSIRILNLVDSYLYIHSYFRMHMHTSYTPIYAIIHTYSCADLLTYPCARLALVHSDLPDNIAHYSCEARLQTLRAIDARTRRKT